MSDIAKAVAVKGERPNNVDLRPAAELAAKSAKPYPNDSAEYRQARMALLVEEIELRRQIERVAKQRRALPMGGEARAYQFLDEQGTTVGLIDMFGAHHTLVSYFWMYGPERDRPCPMCTSLLGSLDIPAVDLEQRVALAVIGRSPVARQLAFARERGWRNLQFYECVGDDFATDYRGLAPDGSEWPALDVWKKNGNKVRHLWAGEAGETADPGEDAHGAPDPMPLWTILDLTPGGRGADWYPKLEYQSWPDASKPEERPMKTMTCKQLGGKCDLKLSADTWDQMVQAMTKHVIKKHPDVAKEMEKMHSEDPKKWAREMKPKWDSTAEDYADDRSEKEKNDANQSQRSIAGSQQRA